MIICFKMNKAIFLLLGLLLSVLPVLVSAQCSEEEATAVFVVSGIDPVTEPQLEVVSIFPVGETTNPSNEEMIERILALQPNSFCDYSQVELVGPYYQYHCWAMDEGGNAIVDSRNGNVAFAGTVIWMGQGEITFPLESSHDWTFISNPDDYAGNPETLGVMDNQYISDFTEEEDAANLIVNYLRQTDVLKSFDDCGPYSVVAYLYTGGLWGEFTRSIVVVNGVCGPPFCGGVVSVESEPWGRVKAYYR